MLNFKGLIRTMFREGIHEIHLNADAPPTVRTVRLETRAIDLATIHQFLRWAFADDADLSLPWDESKTFVFDGHTIDVWCTKTGIAVAPRMTPKDG